MRENARKSRCLYTLLGCARTMSHEISTHKQLSIAQCHITTVSASSHYHTTTLGDNDDSPDNAFASSGPLGKFFIYFFFKLILNLYYRLLQVLPMMHDDNVPCQGRLTTTMMCYIKDDIQQRQQWQQCATSTTTHNSGLPCQWGTRQWRRWPRQCKCIVWAIGKFFFCFFIHL